MTKQDLIQYLVNLATIMEMQEDMGIPRSATLGTEYGIHYDELKQLLIDEHAERKANEAGQS